MNVVKQFFSGLIIPEWRQLFRLYSVQAQIASIVVLLNWLWLLRGSLRGAIPDIGLLLVLLALQISSIFLRIIAQPALHKSTPEPSDD